MTRLVLHTSTPASRTHVVQAALLAAREPLAQSGIHLLGPGNTQAWDRTVRQLLSGGSPKLLRKAFAAAPESAAPESAAPESEVSTVWLSSSVAYDMLRRKKALGRAHDFAAELEAELTVVVVVREQLAMFNELYCRRVAALHTHVHFDSFVAAQVDSGDYAYAQQFRALLDSTDIDFVAVPFSKLESADALPVLLLESRAATEVPEGMRPTEGSPAHDPMPGPVLVLAARLLRKRLARLGVLPNLKAPARARAARLLRTTAVERGWDDTPYWGWSSQLAEVTASKFRHSNAEFAAGVWNADWPDPPPARERTTVDLAGLSPDIVVSVLDTVAAAVDLVRTRPAEQPEPPVED